MVNLGVTRSAKKELSSIDCEEMCSRIVHLVGVSDIFLLFSVHRLEGKEVCGGFFSWSIFLNQLIYRNLLLDTSLSNPMKFCWSPIMPCYIELTCFTILLITFVTSCVVDFWGILILLGSRRWKYYSIFFDQLSRMISGWFLGMLKSLILDFSSLLYSLVYT